ETQAKTQSKSRSKQDLAGFRVTGTVTGTFTPKPARSQPQPQPQTQAETGYKKSSLKLSIVVTNDDYGHILL
ncbi:MAG: hypothetical protein KAH77_11055, partial [Thiomargarita sp.]|nr:hypothetical protein [Thiomargarita sp.]